MAVATTMATGSLGLGEPSRLPAAVYLATSVIVAALFRDMTNFRPSASFCSSLVAARCQVVFSEIVWLELSQVLAKLPHDQQLPETVRRRYRLGEWDASLEVRVEWMNAGVRRFEALKSRFASLTQVAFDQVIRQASLDVMVRHRLCSHDAIHVATARSVGVRSLVTLDADFGRVPDLAVHLLRETTP